MKRQLINGAMSAFEAAERSEDERSETGRSGAAPKAGPPAVPNPEIRLIAKHRRFTAQYKLNPRRSRRGYRLESHRRATAA